MSTKHDFHESSNASPPPWIAQVARYIERYPTEAYRASPLMKLKNSRVDLFNRKTLPGHITASGIVIKDGKILMISHPILNKWLLPGGHIEYGETPIVAAKREVTEETGIYVRLHQWHERRALPFDIDIHAIPENKGKQEPSHLHYDFRYLLQLETLSFSKDRGHHDFSWLEPCHIKEENLATLAKKLESEKLL